VSAAPWLALAVAVVAAGAWLGRRAMHRQVAAFSAGVNAVLAAITRASATERTEILRGAEIDARDQALAAAASADARRRARETELETRARRLAVRDAEAAALESRINDVRQQREAARTQLAARDAEIAARRKEALAAASAATAALEGAARETAAAAKAVIRDTEIEQARMTAARAERMAGELAGDGGGKVGKRIMGIAMGRFYGHYLTERLSGFVPIVPGAATEAALGPGEANLRAIEAVAGVTLSLGEHRDGIRLEGLDGVGREVARRALARLLREPRLAADPAQVTRAAREIATRLDGELAELGRRAFAALEIPLAHAEIVGLVGRLNYRTSFTQNQWKHAIEAGFLCGMMAAELGLDPKVARRAALMHDIGKALTHELDGSHAVIGADYARRLGESEIVANAIGAHHTDEPFSSPYAYLVAAADAMSGARPGARRQTDDNYLTRIGDLERITRGFKGVAEAFAVQGGREVRIYVEEERVDDVGAVDMSGAIAAKISEEMRFPGQIRVTVIREMIAVEVAS
jgi:ribonuclease Y